MLKEPKAHASAMNHCDTANTSTLVRFGNGRVSADEKLGEHYRLGTRGSSTAQAVLTNTEPV
jgi:hypothetical protein